MRHIGPCRILYAPSHTEASDLRELLIFDRGETQYDAVSPWRDLGATKSGYIYEDDVISLWLAEPTFSKIDDDLKSGNFALALLWQDASKVIHARVWSLVSLDTANFKETMDDYNKRRLWRGEATTFPLRFITQNDYKEL